jgi:hypothetical protein
MRLAKQLCLVLAFCALPVALWAQTTTGSISGVVTDPNGAVIPLAKVVATHMPTGRQYTIETTQAGLYVLPTLPPGPYTITVSHTGFKTYVQTGIEVRLDLRETIDIKLELGTLQQTVEVKGTAPVLETVNAVKGSAVTPQQMASLPLWNGGLELANGFIGYMPTVNTSAAGTVSVNGANGRSEEYLIDGASFVSPESGGLSYYFPGFYPYSEMKILTSGYSAENGRVGGGIIEFSTKSGTNNVHGAMLYNFKRQFLDAVSWSNNQNPNQRGYVNSSGVTVIPTGTECKAIQAKACRPMERYNEEGGYAGGPVYIPHVYDGRDKTFWYFTWVGFWQPASVAVNSGETVATAQMLQGNFSEFLYLPKPILIYDPLTDSNGPYLGGTRTAFSGNIIPSNRISKISSNFISQIPAPNAGAPVTLVGAPSGISNAALSGNYAFNSTTTVTDGNWSVKIDHSIHTRNRVAFFITHRRYASDTVQYLPGPLSNGLNSLQAPFYERASDDFTINPHMVLHTLWGFSQDRVFWNNPLQNGWGSKFGFPQYTSDPRPDATPIVNFTNDLEGCCTAWGMNQGKVNSGGQWNWTTQVSQSLTWIHNKHEFKMGWEIRRMRTIGNDWSQTNGTYNFNRLTTAASSTDSADGSAFASFLLGDVDSGTQAALPIMGPQIRYGYHVGFFQDAWRIRPHFTLNLGVRYEVPIGWHIINGNYGSFDPTGVDATAGNLPGTVEFMGVGPYRIGKARPYPTDFTELGPRLGFAWNVKPSVVIRGAWGIYYEAIGNGGCGCTDGFSGGTKSQPSTNTFDPAFNWDPGGYNPNAPTNNPGGVQAGPAFHAAQLAPGVDNFQDFFNCNACDLTYMGPHFGVAPKIYDYNFTIQKEYKNWLFEVAYAGNRGYGMNDASQMNTLPTTVLPLGTAGPTGDTNLLQAPITDTNLCTAAAQGLIPCTNGVPNMTTASWFTSGWGKSATANQSMRPYPQYGTVAVSNAGDGRTWYDSLQLKVEHRFGDLNFMASYVWSKSMAMLSYLEISASTALQAQDTYHPYGDKTYAPEDLPHVINMVSSYRLPFGRGKKWLGNANPVVNHFLGNWMLAWDGQYRSGQLLTETNPTNYLNSETFVWVTKYTATGNPIKTGVSVGSLDPNNSSIRWFNTGTNAAIKATPPFTLGNWSYTNSRMRNPYSRMENISLNKDIRIRESILMHYQINAFDPFNRTDFGSINGTVTSPSFGLPGGATAGPRNITMGLRLEF